MTIHAGRPANQPRWRHVSTLALPLVAVLLAGCAAPFPTESGSASDAIVESLLQEAQDAEKEANYTAAAYNYHKLKLRRPDDLGIQIALARNLRYSGSAADAAYVLERAPDRAARRADYLLELGKAYIALKEPAKALKMLTAARERAPDDWQVHAALGVAHDLAEDFSGARRAYREAARLSKNNPAVINNMALSMVLAGDLDGAIATLENAPLVARRSPQIRQNLALFYGIKGDFETARSLARIDLDEEAVRKNLDVYAQFRK